MLNINSIKLPLKDLYIKICNPKTKLICSILASIITTFILFNSCQVTQTQSSNYNIGNTALTALSPDDHPWHLGLWFSWKYINGVNYWEYSSDNQKEEQYGITDLTAIEIEKHDDYSCTIKIVISYHEKDLPEVLMEERWITISSPTKNDEYYMDFKIVTTSVGDTVELNRTPLVYENGGKQWGGYAGLSLRFNTSLSKNKFINEDGSKELKHGTPFNWRHYGLKNNDGEILGVSLFDHPKNLNNPTPWHVTNNVKYSYNLNFIQPAPLFYTPHRIFKNENLELSYLVAAK